MQAKKDISSIPEEYRGLVLKLIGINQDYCLEFRKQAQMLNEHVRKHPTKIMVFKCMDGRILFSSFTGTPLGFLRNFRNLGGQFDFGWKGLKAALTSTVQKNHEEGRGCLAIITYHHSKGDNAKRGCAGYKCNVKASIDGAMAFKRQIKDAYRGLPYHIFPIVVGIETDEESLKFHNGNGKFLDLASDDIKPSITEDEMFEKLLDLYEHIPGNILADLNPLLMGNVKHVNKIRASNRPITKLEHREWIIGVGGASAYDWLHVPNTALLVGQYNPNIEKPIAEALRVIRSSWEPGKKFLYMSAASYGGNNYEQLVMPEVKYYARSIRETAEKFYPEMLQDMYLVRALVDSYTQEIKIV
jgi:hypothetical protein